MEKEMKKKKTAVAVFFLFLFLTGLLVSGDYGIPFDEKQEQAILNANTREVMLRFGLEKYIPPYNDGKESEYRISTSIEKDHGIAGYYPVAWYVVNRDTRPTKEVSLVWQTYTYCLNFLGVLAVYGIVNSLTKHRFAAAAAALMLFVSPRMFAEMHYNNKDMVCMTLVLVMLYFGVKWTLSPKYRFAVGFGIASALAVNARLVSVMVFGLVGLNYLILLFVKNKRASDEAAKAAVKKGWRSGWLAIGITAAAYFIITPAMWADPVRFTGYLIKFTFNFSRWDDPILFAGGIFQRAAGTPLPRSYLPVLIALTTPLWVLALSLSGTVAAWYCAVRNRFKSETLQTSCMVALCWVVPVLLAVIMRTHVYNGWRQFYFVFGPMVVMAGIAVAAIAGALKGKTALLAAGTVALAGCMLFTGAGLIRNHPYQFGYMNVLAGKDAGDRYELDYWHVSAGPLIRKVMENAGGEKVFTSFVSQDQHALYYAKRQLTEEQKPLMTISDYDWDADYILVNRSYRYRIPEETLGRIEREYHVVLPAVSYGHQMMELYERNS